MLARRLPGIVTVGQQGLVCFVGGSAISIIIDTTLRLAQVPGNMENGIVNGLLRFSGDAATIVALLLIARISSEMKTSHSFAAGSVPEMVIARAKEGKALRH
ncbi:hypothetical protein AB4Y32_37340 [Paraburkholderia phymatum]|uniref:Uncharacterized protein n=1 Tax=Paraburkholderia phymatum TaxID=148447 RepID=A0ACC6UCP2_9BURK